MNNNQYVKHLVECQCTLPIFKNKTAPVYHKIPVFSKVLDENDEIEEKYIICENCDIVHKVHEVFKSDLKWGIEGLNSLVLTKEDVKFNLVSQGYERLVDVLEKNQLHVSDWELTEFLIENEQSGNIVLEKNETDNNIIINMLSIDKGKFKIKKEIVQRYL
jgi:hypothetical protein